MAEAIKAVFKYYPDFKTRAMTYSYDDGHETDKRLVGLFNEYGVKGTFHLNAGHFTAENCVRAQEVKELYSGHEVSAHTYSHPFISKMPLSMVSQEILHDRYELERACGYVVRGMSYPYGEYSDKMIDVLRTAGMEYSRTCEETFGFRPPNDFMKWRPTCHHHDDIDTLWKKFTAYDDMSIFYIWGHSFEFERENNWNRIESFLKKTSGHNEIWFATNIQIYDYIKAVHNLKFGLGNEYVYNPSCVTVFAEVNGQPSRIPPGYSEL